MLNVDELLFGAVKVAVLSKSVWRLEFNSAIATPYNTDVIVITMTDAFLSYEMKKLLRNALTGLFSVAAFSLLI